MSKITWFQFKQFIPVYWVVSAAMRHVVAVLLLSTLGSARTERPAGGPRPYCRDNQRCNYTNTSLSKDLLHYYKVQGPSPSPIQVNVQYQATKRFYLKCGSQSMSVDNPGLPVMEQLQTVEHVAIEGCSAPLNTSYADALEAMNITVTKYLELLDQPANPSLDDQHLAGLPIDKLVIKAQGSQIRTTQNYLDGLLKLRDLVLFNVIPEPEALVRLPKALEYVELWHAQPPTGSTWLERLSSLRNLTLRELNAAEELTLPALKSLPYLTKLHLSYITLNSSSLAGTLKGSSINDLVIRSCGLKNLPDELFEGANLTTLELSLNNLTVQESVFSPLQWLTALDLSDNLVDSAGLVNVVSSLPNLEILKASYNPLDSLCGDANIFLKLRWPKSLRKLDLKKSNIARICKGWIDHDALLDVNLSHNDIRYVNYNDLKMTTAVLEPKAVTIDLTNNPNLRIVNVSSADIKQCSDFTTSNRTRAKVIKLKLSNLRSDAECDYDAFLLHEVVRNCPYNWLQFDTDILSELLKPNKILCQYSGPCLPDSDCSCTKRPRDNATVVRCMGALPRSPPWPPTAPEYPLVLYVAPRTLDHVPRNLTLVELHATGNNITNLDAEDIPDTLLVLNVTYNEIRHISEAAALKLSDIRTNRSVYLRGNRLACNCSDAQALGLLKHVVRDLEHTQCADDFYVLQKMLILSEQCGFPVLPVIGPLFIVLVLLIIWLLLHRFKPQIRRALFKQNWGRRFIFGVKDDDAEKTVDVFLSYAHRDLEILVELKNGLEARGYSTLEHNRDWHPSELISDQIDHSVKSARRTLLLVSDSYADSPWAVKEFHAAHDHAMAQQTARVLVVKYDLCQPEKLPPDLRLYLKYNTYLDWHDNKFWEKLCSAMPMHFQSSN